MNNHSCEALVVTCIDFRLQPYIDQWLKENFQPRTFDRVAFAGGVKNLNPPRNSCLTAQVSDTVILYRYDS